MNKDRSPEGLRKDRAFQRARTRALKILVEQHQAEYDVIIFQQAMTQALAEIDQLGVDVRLKTGRRKEGESITDRIAELCTDCSQHHSGGHKCDVCGSEPGKPAQLVVKQPIRLAPPVNDAKQRQARLRALNAKIMRERQEAS